MRIRLSVWSACALVVAGAVGTAIAAGGGSTASNQAAARADAAKLLARLRLPPGSKQVSTMPNGAKPWLSSAVSAPATPNLVDRHAWWVVPGSPESVIAYVRSRPPNGSKLAFTGSTGDRHGTTSWELGYVWPQIRGILGTRQLGIGLVARAGGGSIVRVDAEDVWVTPRPASEHIPATASRLRVVVRRGSHVRQGPLVFTSHTKLRRVVSLLNRLPLAQPGARACPSDPGIVVTLSFYAGSSKTAVAAIRPYGCPSVQLTLSGKREPTLATWPIQGEPDHATLIGLLERALGLKLRVATITP